MILGIYTVRDIKSGYGQLLLETNNAVAMRNFANAFVDKKGLLFNNSKDFDLFKIGEFDNNTGEIIVQAAELVMSGVDCVRVGESDEV